MRLCVADIVKWLEDLAPRRWAAEWDNVGLQLGDPSGPVDRVMTALSVNLQVLTAAKNEDIDLLVVHHPLLFRPLTSLRQDEPRVSVVLRAIRAGFSVYAAHTNLDLAPQGAGQWAAEALGLVETVPLVAVESEKLLKLTVFVPEQHLEEVRTALTEAGAGHLGKYSHCTFAAPGTGTFLPGAGTQPYLGRAGTLTTVSEYRLETVFPETLWPRVEKAMHRAHPYEEVAYDLYRLDVPGGLGYGRLGNLAEPLSFTDFIGQVGAAFSSSVRVAGVPPETVTQVAIVNGAGSDYLVQARDSGADVFVTGDLKYHEAEEAAASGLCVVDAGHFGTESMIPGRLAAYLRNRAEESGSAVDLLVAEEKDVLSPWVSSLSSLRTKEVQDHATEV